jgi:hypothetical protein
MRDSLTDARKIITKIRKTPNCGKAAASIQVILENFKLNVDNNQKDAVLHCFTYFTGSMGTLHNLKLITNEDMIVFTASLCAYVKEKWGDSSE